ncbi:9606_t:CDS:2 [Cetraspora pellucida]|uniref:9606_t:CDS:1 n=1 Tax=Cetraspora pellucida TaxID=1433469 RepID=A0A9N8VWC0_9GLOM|nr:9606_t:CDS:2 [Cetraspora pellucida]
MEQKQTSEFNFMNKVHYELKRYSEFNTSNREAYQNMYFLLLSKIDILKKNDKQFCKNRFIREFDRYNIISKCVEPMKCNKCGSERYSKKLCSNCILQYLRSLFDSWTSEDDELDKFIQECQTISSLPRFILEWVSYEQFKEIEYFAEGGFSYIYTAIWTRGSIDDWDEEKEKFIYMENQPVVLKTLKGLNGKELQKIYNEAMNHCIIQSDFLVGCYGITKDFQGNYFMVLGRYSEESLRKHLERNHLNFDYGHDDANLVVNILNGVRPPIFPEMPPDFRKLLDRCWNRDPSIRPNIKELFSFSIKKLKDYYKDDMESFIQSLSSQCATGEEFSPHLRQVPYLQQTNSYVHTSKVISAINN